MGAGEAGQNAEMLLAVLGVVRGLQLEVVLYFRSHTKSGPAFGVRPQ